MRFPKIIQSIFERRRDANLRGLEKKIGYSFTDKSMAKRALRHRSFLLPGENNSSESYEQLEFLGDAVLGFVVSEYLYLKYPEYEEGDLSRLKSTIVSGSVLTQCAKKLGLGKNIQLGPGEIRSGGRNRSSLLEDVFESLVGAVYLDGGIKTVKSFLRQHLLSNVETIFQSDEYRNYKSILQEYAQSNLAASPVYRVVNESGPDHKKTFSIEVLIKEDVLGQGEGLSKKRAEQFAARAALKNMGIEE